MAKKPNSRRSEPDLQSKLGVVVRAYRHELKVTQEELAWRSNLHRTYIADIERGARNVTLRSIVSLAQALEVTVGHLLSCAGAPGGPALPVNGADSPIGIGEVLLIEDSAPDAALARRALKRARFVNPLRVLTTAEDGLAFLLHQGRYAKTKPKAPQLILLDLNLPGMSGLEFLRRIKADRRTRKIPVIVLTVSRTDRMIIECGRLGAANYIVKPLNIEGLVQVTPRLNLDLTLGVPNTRRPRGSAA